MDVKGLIEWADRLAADLQSFADALRSFGGVQTNSEHGSTTPYGVIEDGFGSTWVRCADDCRMQVVRPGKVQCDCDFDRWAPPT